MAAGPAPGLLVLGPIRVAAGSEVRQLGDGVAARLLAILAARANTAVSTEFLIDTLWRDEDLNDPKSTLQVQVHRVRKLLEQDAGWSSLPELSTGQRGYRLSADASSLDMLAFEQLAVGARVHSAAGRWDRARAGLEQALDLWDGDPFGGLAREIGLDAEETRLLEMRGDAEEWLSTVLLETPGADIDILRLKRLVDEAPLRERRWGQLMVALYREGRQAEALETYRRAAAYLGEELGIEPGPDLREIEEQILLQDPALRASPDPSSSLPAYADRLIGRTDDIKELAQWIESHRLITLTGLGGIGKTRLAIAAAEYVGPTFSNGVAFVDLSGIESADALLNAIREEVVPRTQAGEGALDAVVNALRERHLLVVLDNAEQVAEHVGPVVRAIIRKCPRVHLLTTGRMPLGVADEHLWPVQPLAVPDHASAGPVSSVVLLVEAARRHRPEFELGPDDEPHAVSVCQATGGIPLAIELAAAGLRLHTIADLAERLRADILHVDDAATGSRKLSGVLGWSLDQLPDDQRRAAAGLAAFRGGCDTEAAGAVLAAVSATVEDVAGLIDAGLVSFDADAGRFAMLVPVRAAAASLDPDLTAQAETAHTAHFVSLANQALPDLNGVGETAWYARFETDHDNYRAVIERAIQRSDPTVLTALPALGLFWFRRSFIDESAGWFDRLEETFDFIAEGQLLAALQASHNAMWSGDTTKAEQRLDRMEPFARQAEIVPLLGRVLHSRGNLAGWGRGEPASSLDLFRTAFDVLAPTGDPLAVVSVVSEAYMAVRCGEFERARETLPRVEAAAEFNEAFGAMGSDQVLGLLAMYKGDTDEADRLLTRSLHLLEQMGLKTLVGLILVPLVWTATLRGRLDEARKRAGDAYHFVTNDSAGWRVGEVCAAFGVVELAAANRASARSWFERGLRAAALAPETDLVIWNAAGLVETADWPNPDLAATAARVVRRASADQALATPLGAAAWFPTVSAAEPVDHPVTVWQVRNAMREAMVG